MEPGVPIFLHVPKTGGTTLRSILVRHLEDRWRTAGRTGGGDWYRFDGGIRNRNEFTALPDWRRDGFVALEGHVYFGIHRCLSRPAHYLTMLREPVERVLSFDRFVRSLPTHHLHARMSGLGLRAALASGLTRELDNFQVRMLSDRGADRPPVGAVDRGMLEEAKKNLAGMAFGLTEFFDESVLLLQRRFGWADARYQRFKVAAGRALEPPVDPALRRQILEVNALDDELYRFACGRFESARGAAAAWLPEALGRLREQSGTRGRERADEPSLRGGVWRVEPGGVVHIGISGDGL